MSNKDKEEEETQGRACRGLRGEKIDVFSVEVGKYGSTPVLTREIYEAGWVC